MSRIKLTDLTMDVFFKMSEGNPGALSALMELHGKTAEIDPQAAMGGLGSMLMLDTWEIYGTDIYILFNDQCNRDVRQMLLLMRATQLGLFSHTELQKLAGDQGRSNILTDEKWSELDEAVCSQLEGFQKKE